MRLLWLFAIVILAVPVSFALEHQEKTTDIAPSQDEQQASSADIQQPTDRIEDIRIANIKRINSDLVFANLPLQIGDTFEPISIATAMRSLYKSGYFDDIRFERDGNVLVVRIVERPTIKDLFVDGNKRIATKDIDDVLKKNNIVVGQVLRRDTLDRIVSELKQVYGAQGRYATVVDVQTVQEEELLVSLQIRIEEANPALIASINIIGNNTFDDDELISNFESNQRDFWTRAFSWAYDANSYARARLAGDLERLRDYYFERGYIDFSIRSTNVTISNDYKNIYISISVDEGKKYLVGETEFVGELIGNIENYTNKILLQTGDVYIAGEATATKLAVTNMLEDLGYGFAQVDLQLERNRPIRTVDLVFVVKPGKRLYVRRIAFEGNTSTTEEAMRRELRIFEGGLFSNAKILESERRLRRLGFFSQVSHQIKNVPGRNDVVDIEFSVEDMPTGSFYGALTYSDASGAGTAFSVSERNIAGTGNSGSVEINITNRAQQLTFDLNRPYINIDGANLQTGFTYYRVNYDSSNIANYATSSYSVNFSLGYPISDDWRLSYGPEIVKREITLGTDPVLEVTKFTDKYGETVDSFLWSIFLNQNSYDSGFMPRSGLNQRYSFITTSGLSDLHFYRFGYRMSYYQPLTSDRKWIWRPTARLGYGKTYSEQDDYPFLFNYFAGGYGTVRGFSSGSLGPRATDQNGEAGRIGGNMLVQSSQELIFPLWYRTERTRFSLFYDIGYVYTDHCVVKNVSYCGEGIDLDQLRSSFGLTVEWHTVIGPFVFIFPYLINSRSGDSTKNFEFALGNVF